MKIKEKNIGKMLNPLEADLGDFFVCIQVYMVCSRILQWLFAHGKIVDITSWRRKICHGTG